MLTLLSAAHFTLPLEDPLLKFLVVLIIILFAPLLLNKIKVPHLIGLIIAGALIGPNGLNVLPRDASIVVIGTTGLLYIMFLAGLEIDLTEFKKNKWKSLGFGLFTFSIPLALGIIAGYYLLGFSLLTAVLFASLFSSHTLIAYPLVSKLGITKNKAVNITVGGTMITDVLALLVLAVCVGMSQGTVTSAFWIKLSLSVIAFGAVVLVVFPLIGRWFFKTVNDKVSHFIFVLVMIYLAGLLAELAGVESIIGAFLAGLALNRLIPHTSALMNRIDFIGNAIFIPFFLISVGMIIDFRAFIKDFETIKVALVMTLIAIGSKYLAAVITQKTFRLKKEEGLLIFGLSSASAAATLAAVMVGYNIIIGETQNGEPIRLLNESVLNGSILMILVSCTVSSFVSQKNADKIATQENEEQLSEDQGDQEKILLALRYQSTVEPLTNLALLAKSKKNTQNIFALNVINEEDRESSEKTAEKLLHTATDIAAAADTKLHVRKRYDTDLTNGINNEIKEHKITDLFIGIDPDKGFSHSLIYNLYNGYLKNSFANTLVYHSAQPLATVEVYHTLIPENAHREPGFFHALLRIWNIARNSGSKVIFYSSEEGIKMLEKIQNKATLEAEFIILSDWKELPTIGQKMKPDEALILMMVQRGSKAYIPEMQKIPEYLSTYFTDRNYLLIYPNHEASAENENVKRYKRDVNNPSDFADIGNYIGNLFK
ncbi:cation:proton antiporter [Bergeyella sp. RCAD1439]|uniref:cation:proton antiporter n=1 Tax=Bergeyella anatis TaxID=3113737 RepID=UPI002E183E31|nr:cation:proton antiporter [Bergeyella sp. RCAD1439]